MTSGQESGPTTSFDCAGNADARGPSNTLEKLRAALQSHHAGADWLAKQPLDVRITQPAARAESILAAAILSPPATVATKRLTVALMGRTKAGKSQLVAALTGDHEGAGVGRGRHRTTRIQQVARLKSFDLLDLPGVAALDGEDDTHLAVQAATQADAVLWLYAESLQDTEAAELEDLLRKGKPVVVAFNTKWAVDDEARRRVFTRTPGLAFRDLASHQERVAQISARAGTQTPPFIAVHARAAWWAAREGDSDLRHASRLGELLAACDSMLTARATVLRVRARHDRPRRQLLELGTAARLAANELGDNQRPLSKTLQREAKVLLRGLEQARSDGSIRLEAASAKAQRKLRRWVAKHQADDDAKLNDSWKRFLERAGLADVLDEYDEDVQREIERSRTSVEAAEFIRQKVRPTRQLSASPDRGMRGRVKFGLRTLRRAITASARALGVGRGVAMIVAKLSGRAVPGVGWWLVGVDALRGLSTGAREELAARRLRTEEWSRDQMSACLDELTYARELVASKLSEADAQTRGQVEERLNPAKAALRKMSRLRQELLKSSDVATEAIKDCDRELVEAILMHAGDTTQVADVQRAPNEKTTVTFGVRGDHARPIAVLNDLLMPEKVTERDDQGRTLNRRRSRRMEKQ